VSLGLTRQGVLDESGAKPIELVFLILAPADIPAAQIQVLALVSRAAQNRQLVQSLSTVRHPEEALGVIRNWETLQQPGAVTAARS
jgi:two-component system, OmpR family, sensor histidine kinase KdpD